MLEENKVEDTTENTNEEISGDTTPTNDSSNELEEKYKELEEKNKQLFERAKKAEIKAKELEAKSTIEHKEVIRQETTDPLEVVKLAQGLKDYSVEEVELISRQAKALGLGLLEAKDHEDTQILIQAKREKIKKDAANPTPTNTQPANDKSFEDWSSDDISRLTSNPTKDNIEKLNEYNAWARRSR
jgi:hypothetical protein